MLADVSFYDPESASADQSRSSHGAFLYRWAIAICFHWQANLYGICTYKFLACVLLKVVHFSGSAHKASERLLKRETAFLYVPLHSAFCGCLKRYTFSDSTETLLKVFAKLIRWYLQTSAKRYSICKQGQRQGVRGSVGNFYAPARHNEG